MLAGYGVACSGRWGRSAAALAAALFVLNSAPAAWRNSTDYRDRGRAVRTLVLGVAQARQLHPRATILLNGVDNGLFWGGVCDGGLRVGAGAEVYLAPGSERRIRDPEDLCDVPQFILPYEAVQMALDRDRMVVYRVGGPRLRNITHAYRPEPAEGFRLDLGSRTAEPFLGPEWYETDGFRRWAPKRATLRLPFPLRGGQSITLRGAAPGALGVEVSLSGRPLGRQAIPHDGDFQLRYRVPEGFTAPAGSPLEIEGDRSFKPAGETRELGLAFGSVDVRPVVRDETPRK